MSWHGTRVGATGLVSRESVIALMLRRHSSDRAEILYAAFNMYWDSLDFDFPSCLGSIDGTFANTANLPPEDVCSQAGASSERTQAGPNLGAFVDHPGRQIVWRGVVEELAGR